MTTKMITPKQADYIRSLVAEVRPDIPVDEEGLAQLTRVQASHQISALLEKQVEVRAAFAAEMNGEGHVPQVSEADQLEPVLPEGYFTVVLDGEGHRTFRVKDASAQSALVGKRIISYLSGSDNEHDYTGFGFVGEAKVQIWKRFSQDSVLAEAAKLLVGDPDAAQKGYALHSGNCYRCGRLLTDPVSIDLGIGPICRSV